MIFVIPKGTCHKLSFITPCYYTDLLNPDTQLMYIN